MSDHERRLIQEYSLKEGLPEGASGSLTKDVYEKAVPKHGDLWFHKFASVMQHNPGHVIRYIASIRKLFEDAMAQMAERRLRNSEIPGSNPAVSGSF